MLTTINAQHTLLYHYIVKFGKRLQNYKQGRTQIKYNIKVPQSTRHMV